jgi:hypothetical protein
MFTTTIIVWTAAIALAGVLGLALVAGLAVDFAVRNRSLRLARHESIRSYYGHGHFSLSL